MFAAFFGIRECVAEKLGGLLPRYKEKMSARNARGDRRCTQHRRELFFPVPEPASVCRPGIKL